jgi:hypothetical protein
MALGRVGPEGLHLGDAGPKRQDPSARDSLLSGDGLFQQLPLSIPTAY